MLKTLNDNQLDTLHPAKRVQVGLAVENAIVECMKLYGYDLREVTSHEDQILKIDRYWYTEEGVKKVQIKTRVKGSGDDILVDLWEPFFGIDNKDTKPGRDMKSPYDLYVCLSKDKATIRVIDGKRQKELIAEVIAEWAEAKYQLRVFDSKKYPGCQLRYHVDAYSKKPKLLMFINPKVYKEGSEVKYLEMKND